MIEIVIHGRGGRGGVTLGEADRRRVLPARQVRAGLWRLRCRAHRSAGTGVRSRRREEITVHNPITAPDHVVIVEPSLIGAAVVAV